MERRGNDPTNTATVPVLDREGRPLMPTRPSRARRLLRDGRAVKVWRRGVFAIRMTDVSTDDPDTVVDGVEINIDPGSSATGIAVVSDRDAVRHPHALIELRHRGSRVRNRMERRSSLRRNRMGRIRNRPPRFDNRTRSAGWRPPSLTTRLDNTMTWVGRLRALYPVSAVRVETAVFDTQLMQNAEISGEQYQQGNLLGWQLRSYVFHRDGRRCVYCDNEKAERYELDHVVPRSLRGSDRAQNLVVSCHDCNVRKGNQPVSEFLADRPDRLRAVRRLQGQALASATHMNMIVPELVCRLEATGLTVAEHDSYTTSWTRRRLEVPKTHANDALCLGAPCCARSSAGAKDCYQLGRTRRPPDAQAAGPSRQPERAELPGLLCAVEAATGIHFLSRTPLTQEAGRRHRVGRPGAVPAPQTRHDHGLWRPHKQQDPCRGLTRGTANKREGAGRQPAGPKQRIPGRHRGKCRVRTFCEKARLIVRGGDFVQSG